MGQWIVGASASGCQKINGFYCVECPKMEKWSAPVHFCWVWWVCLGDEGVVNGSVDSGCHKLSENILSKTYINSEYKLRCYRCGTATTAREGSASQFVICESFNSLVC